VEHIVGIAETTKGALEEPKVNVLLARVEDDSGYYATAIRAF